MDKITILTYLAATNVLLIPNYQREYCWGKENCFELFDDLRAIIRRPNQTHYMGAIISSQNGTIQNSNNRKSIIDGQQRLTTLSLLILAMLQLSKEEEILTFCDREDEDIFPRSSLENAIWNNNGRRLILRHTARDNEKYSNIVEFIRSDRTGLYRSDNDNIENCNAIFRNFNYLYEQVLNYAQSCGNPVTAGANLYDGLNKLVFIDITLDERDDPQQVFESMNATGVDLTEFDKCRNFFLINTTNISDELLVSWNRIEQSLGDITSRRNVDRIQDKFLYAYLKFHKSRENSPIKLQEKKYYNYIKLFIKRNDSEDNHLMRDFLNEVASLSEDFKNMQLAQDPSNDVRVVLQRMSYLDNTQFWPVILALYLERRNNGLSDSDFVTALSAIDTYNIRRAVCDQDTRSSTGMSKYILRQLTSYRWNGRNKSDLVRACILRPSVPSYSIPTDKEFNDALNIISYSEKRKLINTLLWSIESYLRRNSGEIDCSRASIEHIMPQTITAEWRTELSIINSQENVENVFELWLHRLGNLTLTGYNSEYQNASFNIKKTLRDEETGLEIGFNSSAFRLNESVRNCEQWTRIEIESRHQYLCELCREIWQMPVTNIDINSPIEEDDFALDELNQDTDFTGYDFADISIDGEIIRNDTNNSMDFVNSVVYYLCNNYPNVMIRIAESVVSSNPNSSQHVAGQNDLISTTMINRQSWHELFRNDSNVIYIKTRQQRGNFISIVRRDFINLMSQCNIELSNVIFHIRHR